MDYKEGDFFCDEYVVSEKIYEDFMQLFGDRSPLHTQDLFAQSRGFKAKLMHGNILNGYISYFVGACLPTDAVCHVQEIQYKNPVYVNDKLNFKATVVGVFESVNAVEFKFEFRNADALLVAKGKLQIGIL